MVKKLRNREVQQGSNTLQNQKSREVQQKRNISKNVLRFLARKNARENEKRLLCRNRRLANLPAFTLRISTGQIGSILCESRWECAICLELMVSPRLLQCGHMYCQRCLQSSPGCGSRCSLCRQQHSDESPLPSQLAQTVIDEFLLPRSNQILKYLVRTTEHSEWIKKRKIGILRVGTPVDYQQSGKTWRRGIVVAISSDIHQKITADIKISVCGVEKIENVDISSRRLAPYGFFTRGRYLEQFPVPLPEAEIPDALEGTEQLNVIEEDYRDSERMQESEPREEWNSNVQNDLVEDPIYQVREEDDWMLQLFNHQMEEGFSLSI